MRILSIDAWGNKYDGYDWNAWYEVGNISIEDFDSIENYALWFVSNDYVNAPKELYYVNDDGFNIVIYVKATHKPLFAIEYGNEY